MAEAKNAIPIAKSDLKDFAERATRFLQVTKWRPKPGLMPKEKQPQITDALVGVPQLKETVLITAPQEEQVSILESARRVAGDTVFLSDTLNHILLTLRTGIQIGAHLSKLYERASNFDGLKDLNAQGKMTDLQRTEFRSKSQTASSIALFALAYYIVWDLESKAGDVEKVNVDFSDVPEFALRGSLDAVQCALFYYGAYLESGSIRTEQEFIKLTLVYFKRVLEELKLRKDSFAYLEPFTSCTYQLEESEFNVQGFETEISGGRVSVEFKRTSIEEMVGNRDAKHHASRLTNSLLTYSPKDKRNPMFDLGGFTTVILGHGKPGTGKSMMISVTATQLNDRCKEYNYPFLFWQMPDTMVSSFQGKSAEHMYNWISALRDTSKIIYAPIDDAENNLEERTRQNASEGTRQIVGVFLRNSESAVAVWRGNAVLALYTNIPDQIDKAVLSRVQTRFSIDGAKTIHDFLDQDYLWWKRYLEINPGFVNLRDPDDYAYLTEQKLVKRLDEIKEYGAEIAEATISDIVKSVEKRYPRTSHMFFATLFAEVMRAHPQFSSRDLRNIQSAVSMRIMDFDYPEHWEDHPEDFFFQPYDRKMAMLKELMIANMHGLSFADIRYQETVRYLDEMIKITEKGKRRRIEERAEQIEIEVAAQERARQNVTLH
ncbi:MAG: AAA family ATPase [Candidatus Sungbacteria bacterium]|nr:AAA family ATPase [Candidatus Sungbacteria bacterium]